jgi:hypothetical protein
MFEKVKRQFEKLIAIAEFPKFGPIPRPRLTVGKPPIPACIATNAVRIR